VNQVQRLIIDPKDEDCFKAF